jgi:DNA-binding GntR family transcriptional regulator
MVTSVVEELRADILESVFMPGERLVELSLCERYDCGRAAVRAALLQLESEGIVERQANRGAVVRRVTVAEAIEMTEARSALESLVAARAARNANDEEVEELQGIVEEMRDAVANDDAPRYSGLNKALHRRIREISRHTVAAEILENLRNRAVQNQYRLAMVPDRQKVSLEQHAAIVDAIAKHDEEAAAEAMGDHLMSVIEVLGRWGDAPIV